MTINFELISEFETFDDEDYYETRIILTDHDEKINKIIMAYNEYNDIMKKLDNIHYEDNIYCSRYLGDYIERYVMEFLGGEMVPAEMEDRRNGILRRPVDFLLDYNRKKLKIKHVAGCLIYGQYGNDLAFYWKFDIDFNYSADAFLLSAWDTRKSLVLQYMWLIMKNEIFGNLPFWKRDHIQIVDTKARISEMENYEMKVRLGVLQNIIAHVKKNDLISLLIDKRRDILFKIDIEINLKRLANVAMSRGLNKIKWSEFG